MGVERIWVRANVNLPGFPAGQHALVNVDQRSIRGFIAAGYLHVCTFDESAELDELATQGGQRG